MSVQTAIALGVGGELLAAALLLGLATLFVRLLGCLDANVEDGESDSGGGGGGGGGGDDRPLDHPSDGGNEVEPAWWPQFERDFGEYAASTCAYITASAATTVKRPTESRARWRSPSTSLSA